MPLYILSLVKGDTEKNEEENNGEANVVLLKHQKEKELMLLSILLPCMIIITEPFRFKN